MEILHKSGLISLMSLLSFSNIQANDFIDDSKLTVNLKNFYFNRDFRKGASNPSGANKFLPENEREGYRSEWAQGLITNFESGFTEGNLKFGFDAYSLTAIKLYSDKYKTGTNLLEIDENGNATDVNMEVGASIKMKHGETLVVYGDQFPSLPVINTSTVRLLPSSSRGLTINDNSFKNLKVNAGYFYSLNPVDSVDQKKYFTTDYGVGITGDSVSYLGFNYEPLKNKSISLYYSEFEDVWRQTFLGAKYNFELNNGDNLNLNFVGFNNADIGGKRGGDIDSTALSLLTSYKIDQHNLSIGYQQIFGNEPFDWIGFNSIGGNAVILNAAQFSTFSEAKEKSVQLKYEFDFKKIGISGLNFMTRYIYGWDVDNTDSNNPYYTGRFKYNPDINNKHWERDIQLSYNLQNGFAKGLDIKLRQATHRSTKGYRHNDIDEIRVIVEYPFSF